MNNNKYINWYLSSKPKFINEIYHYDKALLAELILSSIKTKSTETMQSGFDVQIYNLKKDHRSSIIKQEIIELKKLINEYKFYIYDGLVHGSYSTNDMKAGWSDLDCLIILKKENFNNILDVDNIKEFSNKANLILKKIDPLSHHDFQYIFNSDLLGLHSSIFSPILINECISLLNKNSIRIKFEHIVDKNFTNIAYFSKVFSNAVVEGYLNHHPFNGTYLQNHYLNSDNGMYQLKYMLSVLVLMPALGFTSLGIYISKPDAILLAKKLFKNIDWSIIDICTEIRNLWPIYESNSLFSNKIPVWIFNYLPENYFEMAEEFTKNLLKNFINYENKSIK